MRHLLTCIFATLALCLLLPACNEEKTYYEDNAQDDVPTSSTRSVDTYVIDSGYTRFRVITPQMDVYDGMNRVWKFPYELKMYEFDKDSVKKTFFRCDSAIRFIDSHLFRFDGRVLMINIAGDTLKTEQLFYDENQKKIYTDSFVHFVRDNSIFEGWGFESYSDMSEYEIRRMKSKMHYDSDKGAQDTVASGPDESPSLMQEPPRRSSERSQQFAPPQPPTPTN